MGALSDQQFLGDVLVGSLRGFLENMAPGTSDVESIRQAGVSSRATTDALRRGSLGEALMNFGYTGAGALGALPFVPSMAGVTKLSGKLLGTKVVDNAGEPLKLYHGRTDDFSVFDSSSGKRKSNAPLFASSFSTSPEIASSYAGKGKGANVYPAHINLQNPLIIDAKGMNWSSVPVSKADTYYDSKYMMTRDLRPGDTIDINSLAIYANEHGHDGLIVKNVTDAGNKRAVGKVADTVMAFKPEQVVSLFDDAMEGSTKLYRGRPAQRNQFDHDIGRLFSKGASDTDQFWTTDRSVAEGYAKTLGKVSQATLPDNAKVLTLINPDGTIDSEGRKLFDALYRKRVFDGWNPDEHTWFNRVMEEGISGIRNDLKAMGYDAVRSMDLDGPEMIVLNPSILKD